MKKIFERWNDFVDTEKKTAATVERSFTFSGLEVQNLNRAIGRIVNTAKKVLGAEGPTPLLSLNNFEEVKLDKTQKDSTPVRMVAEQDDDLEALRQKYHGTGGELERF